MQPGDITHFRENLYLRCQDLLEDDCWPTKEDVYSWTPSECQEVDRYLNGLFKGYHAVAHPSFPDLQRPACLAKAGVQPVCTRHGVKAIGVTGSDKSDPRTSAVKAIKSAFAAYQKWYPDGTWSTFNEWVADEPEVEVDPTKPTVRPPQPCPGLVSRVANKTARIQPIGSSADIAKALADAAEKLINDVLPLEPFEFELQLVAGRGDRLAELTANIHLTEVHGQEAVKEWTDASHL